MSKLKVAVATALLTTSMVAGAASAQTVSVYDFDTNFFFRTYLNSQGYTANGISSAFTASDIAGSQLVILSGLSSVSSSQVSALNNYVNGGGHLFVLADAAGYSTALITTLNTISAGVGSTIVDTGGNYDSGYQTTTHVTSDAFTAGVSNIQFAFTSGLTGGTSLIQGNSGQGLISYQKTGNGYFFASADTNIGAGLSNNSYGNGRLLTNFLTVNAVAMSPVPEPASWALMILGIGAVGFAMRRRSAGVTATVRYA